VFERGRVLRGAVVAVLLWTLAPVVGWAATGAALAQGPDCLPTAARPPGPYGFAGLGKTRKQCSVDTNAAPPVMLVFHPGGWILAPGHPMTAEQEAARMQGFETINVDYVLNDVPTAFAQAVRLAKQLKKRGLRVYAYGESSGGTMAAFLAQRGLVDAAAVHSPVSSIPDFINQLASSGKYSRDFFDQLFKLTPQTEEVFSPRFRRKESKRPIFAIAPQSDALSPGTVEWANHDPNVTLVTPLGNHLEQSNFPEMLAQSMSWLRNRVKPDKREDHEGRQRTKKPRDPVARPASFDRRATQMNTGALDGVIRPGSADRSLPVRRGRPSSART
jgi:acetyl esterase/lipase